MYFFFKPHFQSPTPVWTRISNPKISTVFYHYGTCSTTLHTGSAGTYLFLLNCGDSSSPYGYLFGWLRRQECAASSIFWMSCLHTAHIILLTFLFSVSVGCSGERGVAMLCAYKRGSCREQIGACAAEECDVINRVIKCKQEVHIEWFYFCCNIDVMCLIVCISALVRLSAFEDVLITK